MRDGEKQFSKLLFYTIILAIILPGCMSKQGMVKARETVENAEKHFETVQTLNAERTYPDNFVTARDELFEAKKYLEKKWMAKKALPAAENSLSASKIILKRYYLDGIAKKADKLRQTIIEKIGDDYDSPLKDYLPELDDVLNYAEELETGQQIASLDKVLASLDVCIKIQDVSISYTSDKLESDVSFDIGSYDLSGKGIRSLEENFLRKIIADKENYKGRYPDSIITLKIKVVGYTDEVGFDEKKPLFKEISAGVENELPPKYESEERRKFLNRRLSKFRARAISSYIKQRILRTERGSKVKVEPESVGNGENIPPGISPSGSANDPQRRICKIYSTINYMAQ